MRLEPSVNEATKQAQFTEYTAARLPWLRRVAYLLCQDWHRADDLVQSSVTKLYLNWDRVDRAGSPDGYVRAILVNTFLEEQRSPWWKRVVLRRDRDGAEPDARNGENGEAGRQPAAVMPDLDGALDLRRALAKLSSRHRTTLVLRYYCELSVMETAHLLGCSEGTVKSQTARALHVLRQLMGVVEPGAAPDRPGDPPASTGSGRAALTAPARTAATNHLTRSR